MKKRTRLFGLLLLCAVGLGLYFFLREKEFVYQGKPARQWALDLISPERTTREQAEQALKEMGAQALPSLIAMLNTRDPFYLRPLLTVTSLRGSLQPHLFRIFKPLDPMRKRHSATMALQILGPAAEPAIPALGRVLRDADVNISWCAGDVLAGIGRPAIPELLTALDPRQPLLFSRVCTALAKAGPDAVSAIPALVQAIIALETESERTAPPAANRLATATSGQGAPTPTPGNLAAQAARTLSKIGPAAVPSLRDLLQNPSPGIRQRAIQALGGMGPRGRGPLPALLELLKDESAAVRAAAVEAVSQVRPGIAPVLTNFIPLLQDADEEVRLAAVRGLTAAPRTNDSVRSALTAALQDESGQVRREAEQWLKEAGSPSSTAKD